MSDLLRAMAAIRAQGASAGLYCFWDGGWDTWIGPEADQPTAKGHFWEEDIRRIPVWFGEHGSAFRFEKSSGDPVVEVMAELYASEINCGLICHRGSGWEVWLGDDWGNGRDVEARLPLEQGDRISGWLRDEALKAYPRSQFAKRQSARVGEEA